MKKIVVTAIILFHALLSFSQESISKDVKVVNSYTPEVSQATKISLTPQIDDTTSIKPTFKYKIGAKKMDAEFVTQPIAPASMTKEKVYYAPTSLAKLGVGNYSTAFAELYYNILKSEKYAVGLNLDHLSTIGNLKLSNDSLVKAPYHLTNIGLSASRFNVHNTLFFDLNFNRTGTEYYGLETLNSSKNYYLNSKSNATTGGDVLIDEDTQRHSAVDISAGISKYEGEEKNDAYYALFRFSNYGNRSGVSENTIFIDGDYKHYVENFYLQGFATIESNSLSMPSSSTLYNYSNTGKTTITIAPRIGFLFSRTEIQLGLNLFSQMGDSIDKNVYIGPHLTGSINLAEGIVTAFGGVKSSLKTNSYRTIAYENNFIAPDLQVKSSFEGATLFGGVKGNFSAKTSFLVQASYTSFNDEHFYINKMYRYTDPTITALEQKFDYSNRFGVVYDNGKVLTIYGEFIVKASNAFELKLNGSYNDYKLNTYKYAWNKPELELGLKSTVKPWEGWKFNADINFIGDRYAYNPTTQTEKVLDSIVDINLSGEYQYNQKWMFFGGIYNILANKYYKWYEYPSQGVNFRAGVGLSF